MLLAEPQRKEQEGILQDLRMGERRVPSRRELKAHEEREKSAAVAVLRQEEIVIEAQLKE